MPVRARTRALARVSLGLEIGNLNVARRWIGETPRWLRGERGA